MRIADILEATGSPNRDLDHGSVTVFGQRIDVLFRWDNAELDRRRAVGLGAITSREALRALSELPAGLPVPARHLDMVDRLVLGELHPGVVEEAGSNLTRHVIPPVHLLGIVKQVEGWADVQGLTLLRTHAPRVAIAERRVARRILTACDTDLGVAVLSTDGLSIVRPPGRRWVKPSWQRWLLAETVLASIYDAEPTTSSQL